MATKEEKTWAIALVLMITLIFAAYVAIGCWPGMKAMIAGEKAYTPSDWKR